MLTAYRLPLRWFSYLVIFSFIFTLNSCEQDLVEVDEIPGTGKIERISFARFSERANGQTIFKQMSRYLDINSSETGLYLQKSDTVIAVPTILTDEVLHILEDGMSYNTFKMRTPGVNDRFSNLIVHLDSLDNITRTQIYEYEPDATWMADIAQPYHGTLRVYDNAIIPVDSLFNKSMGSGLCPTVSGRWKCGADKNHSPDTPNPPCRARNFEYTISVSYGPCPGDPVDEVIVDPDIGNNGGGGTTPRNGGTRATTIPAPPCDSTSSDGAKTGIISSDPCGGNGDNDDDDDDMEEDNTCEKVGNKFARRDYDSIVNILKTKFRESREYGYKENDDQSFDELSAIGSNQLDFTPTITTRGVTHIHTDDSVIIRIINGVTIEKPGPRNIRIQSPEDVFWFFKQLRILREEGIPLSEAYNTVVSSTGTWEIRVADDFVIPDLTAFNPSADFEINTRYQNLLYGTDDDDLGAVFLNVFASFGLEDVKLYEIIDNKVYEHQLDSNYEGIKIKCHEE